MIIYLAWEVLLCLQLCQCLQLSLTLKSCLYLPALGLSRRWKSESFHFLSTCYHQGQTASLTLLELCFLLNPGHIHIPSLGYSLSRLFPLWFLSTFIVILLMHPEPKGYQCEGTGQLSLSWHGSHVHVTHSPSIVSSLAVIREDGEMRLQMSRSLQISSLWGRELCMVISRLVFFFFFSFLSALSNRLLLNILIWIQTFLWVLQKIK